MMATHKQDGRPSFQFYPSDWLREPGLRLCSLEAKGLWIELLCLMWYGTPRGFLNANGLSLDNRAISKLIAEPIKKIDTLMAELKKHKVFDISDNGTIFCRRMYREYGQKSEAGKKGADSRWHSEPNGEAVAKDNPSSSSASSSASASAKKREIVPNGTRAFLTYFGDLWTQKVGNGKTYPCAFGKEGEIIKDLLKIYSFEELSALARRFFELDDDWLRDKGYTIGIFKTQLPKLIAGKKGKKSQYEKAMDFADELKIIREERQNAGT